MATTYYTDIQKLYVAYFNRPADPKGLAFWETAVEAAKGSTAGVAAEFAKQAEYTAAYSSLTNAQIVNQVYLNLFGRGSAGDTGADFWVKGLDNKTITVADVVTAVAAGAQGTDKTAFTNKVTAASAFTAALDTDAEVAGYVGTKANDIAKTFLAGITDDFSLAAAITPAALNATVGSAVAAGTPFSVAGALANLAATQKALDTFVTSIDLDNNSKTVTTAAQIKAFVGTKDGAVADLITGDAQNLYKAAGTSDATKTALINAQVTNNAAKLSDDQKALATANSNVAAVDGLSSALSTLTATKTSLTAAKDAQTIADADLAAKLASLKITAGAVTFTAVTPANGSTAAVAGKVEIDVTDAQNNTTKVKVADISATTGVMTIVSGVDADDFPGLTAYISSYNADQSAIAATAKAQLSVDTATTQVNHLDVDAVTKSTVTGFTNETEKTLLDTVTSQIKALTTVTVTGTATEDNITTALNQLKVKAAGGVAADVTNYNDFVTLTNAYHTTAASNPLVSKQTGAADTVKADTKAITDFTKAVADLNTAKANAATLGGYEATLAAASKVFDANGYHLANIDADLATGLTSEVGSAASDVFVVGKQSTDISLFNLQGKDSLYIGTGFTLVKGAPAAANADDAKLQAFVSQNGADTVIQIETHTYSSSVASTAGEIVTIKLIGIDATTIGLDANGIITSTVATA